MWQSSRLRPIFAMAVSLVAAMLCGPILHADPSPPIEKAMQVEASLFDVFLATLSSEIRYIFDKSALEARVNARLARLIRKLDVDEMETYVTQGWVSSAVQGSATTVNEISYDFAGNKILIELTTVSEPGAVVNETALTLDDEKKRKQFVETQVQRAWDRIHHQMSTHPLRLGYQSKDFDEKAFREECISRTELTLKWFVNGDTNLNPSVLGKAFEQKGINMRAYTGKRLTNGKIIVDYDDFLKTDPAQNR